MNVKSKYSRKFLSIALSIWMTCLSSQFVFAENIETDVIENDVVVMDAMENDVAETDAMGNDVAVPNVMGNDVTAADVQVVEAEKNMSDSHTHDFTGAWLSDESGHWHKCPEDEATDEKAAHVFDDETDVICNICGYERALSPSSPSPSPIPDSPTEYGITVNQGKASVDGVEVTAAEKGTVITLTADEAPEGQIFSAWIVVSGNISLADIMESTTTFTMTEETVEITAKYDYIEKKKVDSISITGVVEPKVGEETAFSYSIPSDAGYTHYGAFAGYSAERSWAEMNVMPGSFADVAEWDLFAYENSTGYVHVSSGSTLTYKAGSYYVFIFPIELKTGYIWADSVSATVNGRTGQFLRSAGPLADCVICTFGPLEAPITQYGITVQNGTASIDGTVVTVAEKGNTVTITADEAPEGQVFAGWNVVSGAVSLADANADTTTFTMPEAAVEITATYKNKETPAVSYKIIEGNGQTVTKGNTARFVSNAPFEKLSKVQVDGKDVNSDKYTAASGSTAITFTADFIKNLSTGSHSISIVSNDGEAKGTFKVKEVSNQDTSKKSSKTTESKAKTKSSPKTGDSSNLMLWFLLLLVSGVGLIIITVQRKKNTR